MVSSHEFIYNFNDEQKNMFKLFIWLQLKYQIITSDLYFQNIFFQKTGVLSD